MSTAFISGHTDLSQEEFETHYRTRIDEALSSNHAFVIGDARGADSMALQYLSGKTTRVTIYHIGEAPRVTCPGSKASGGFTSHKAKDAAMTAHSTYDILWVRSAEEQRQRLGAAYDPKRLSGTEQNRRRRSSASQ